MMELQIEKLVQMIDQKFQKLDETMVKLYDTVKSQPETQLVTTTEILEANNERDYEDIANNISESFLMTDLSGKY